MNQVFVAQIFNLPYRRFAIGRAAENSGALDLADAPQNAILRYGRLQICATSSARRFMVPMRALWACRLSMNFVAADVSPLLLDQSLLTSAATVQGPNAHEK
ncbi:MAG: hypothetical protein HY735_05310 [Verrucomicrobia bacterium]|nr:hypothetical protein [Verrucomicrobiota bacterium]